MAVRMQSAAKFIIQCEWTSARRMNEWMNELLLRGCKYGVSLSRPLLWLLRRRGHAVMPATKDC